MQRKPPQRLGPRHANGVRRHALARQRVEKLLLERRPQRVGQLEAEVGSQDRADVEVGERFAVHVGGVGECVRGQVGFIGGDERLQLGGLVGIGEGGGRHVLGRQPRHAQLANRRPQRFRHPRLLGQTAEVRGRLRRQIDQQPHDQRGADAVGRRIEPAVDEEGRRHLKRHVEGTDEAQVRPIRSVENQALTQRVAEGERGDEDPFHPRTLGSAELSELRQEGIHVSPEIIRDARCAGNHVREHTRAP